MSDPSPAPRSERLRIAQLSDLHCDGTDAWAKNFGALVDLLCREAPDLVIITGDCADHPRTKYYRQLGESLKKLQEKLPIRSGISTPICLIPGNHDYSYFGNRLLGLLRRHPFHDGLKTYIADDSAFKGDLGNFAIQHGVVVYPFDSNLSRIGRIAFARGRVDDPRDKFKALATGYRGRIEASGRRWDTCIHLAILHHHPLPLPDTVGALEIEQFHILDNAAEFLSAACDAGVHLILHGHKHVSGMAEYRYTGRTERAHRVCVSSCGTSSKVGASEREVCLFDLLPSGSISVRRLRANGAESTFLHDDGDAFREVIRYADRRKRRALDRDNWLLSNSRIRSIRRKTKVVRVLENGRAYVKVTFDGIEWLSGHARDVIFREFLHGGIGRVAGGWCVYRDSSGFPRTRLQKLNRDLTRRDTDKFEGYWFDFPAFDSPDAPPSRFEVRYVLHSGYCLSAREYAEAFQVQHDDVCRETATIEGFIPTESVELIVNFPPDKTPAEEAVYLDAWKLEIDGPKPGLEAARRKYEVDIDESQYVRSQGAIHYRSELNQISVTIRHPQPCMAYTLGWTLPPASLAIGKTESHYRFERFLKSLLPIEHANIESAIRKGLQRTDIRVSVFVYESPNAESEVGQLTIVQPADQRRSAFVGRGIVGQAFRSRRLQYHTQSPVSTNRRLSDSQVLPTGTPEDFLWVDSVLAEPLDPGMEELLVVPLSAPVWEIGFDERTETTDLPVAGLLLIARYGDECHDPNANFFPFDVNLPAGLRSAQEMVSPMIGIVHKVSLSRASS